MCAAAPPVIVFGDHTCIFKYIDFPFAMGADGVKVLKPKIEADTKYLFYYLRRIHLPDTGYDRHFKYLKRSTIPLPPLAEQKRIATVLDKADDLRGKRRPALATLDTLLQSVFLDMFGDPVTNPKAWPVRRLGDECDVRDGTHDSPEYVAKGVPLVTSKNLRYGRVDLDEAQLISEEDYEQICRRSRVHRGDIIMPMIGTIGNPVLVEDEPHYAIKNVALIKFVPASPLNTYVRMLLAGSFLESMKSRSAKGGTQQFISLGDIRSFPVPLPPLSLQREWNDFYMRSRGFMAVITKHRHSLDILFAALQSAAFAGTLFNGEAAKRPAGSRAAAVPV